MFKIHVSPHRLGHCGLEGEGSYVGAKDLSGEFASRDEADKFIKEWSKNSRCKSCGGYSGTVADPGYMKVIEV